MNLSLIRDFISANFLPHNTGQKFLQNLFCCFIVSCTYLIPQQMYSQPQKPVGEWVSIGPEYMNTGLGATGRVTSIAVDPVSPNTIYVGSRGMGVWKTTNRGSSWRPVADNLPSLLVQSLVIAPSNRNLVYTVTSAGVFRSTDGGSSWTPRFADRLETLFNSLIVHPSNPDILYQVYGHKASDPGIYQSKDGGSSWTKILGDGYGSDLLMDPSNPLHLYAAIVNESDVSKTGIYETFNGGDTPADWVKKTGCPGGSLPAITDPETNIKISKSGNRLFASFKNGTSFNLYRTMGIACSIGGRPESSWERCWTPTGDNPEFKQLWNRIYTDPRHPDHVFATGTKMWVSTDGGSHFSAISGSAPHVDYHAFAIDPGNTNSLFVGTDGGIYASSMNGSSGWQFIGRGIANTELYGIATASTKLNFIMGATQDNGLNRYEGSKSWKHLVGGDAQFAEISPVNNDIQYYIGLKSAQIYKSTNGGNSFSHIGTPIAEDCGFSPEFPPDRIHQVLADPNNADIVYVSCKSLWRGTPFTKIFTPTSGDVSFMAMQKGSNPVYAGTTVGSLYKINSSSSFELIFSHLRRSSFTHVEIDPQNEQNMYLTFSGSRAGRIYFLKKRGSNYDSLDITANLPVDIRVNTIAADRSSGYVAYAGTSFGVYMGSSRDNGVTWNWRPYKNQMPLAVYVTDLQIHPISGVLRAGTYGRGAYEVNITDPIGSVLSTTGKVVFLRVHNKGGGYGSGNDKIDGELIIKNDAEPMMTFGLQLRNDGEEVKATGMMEALHDAWIYNKNITIEYTKKSLHTGMILRVVNE